MNIVTERLDLYETGWMHIEYIHQLHLCPEVDEFNTLGIPKNADETREVMRPAIEDRNNTVRKEISWSVFKRDTNEFIGAAGMHLTADKFKSGEIYYKLFPESWGKGYATEIAKGLIKFGFEKLHLHRIEAGVQTENTRSIKVLEKAGMINEGLRRRNLPIRGEWKDSYHFAIVKDNGRGAG